MDACLPFPLASCRPSHFESVVASTRESSGVQRLHICLWDTITFCPSNMPAQTGYAHTRPIMHTTIPLTTIAQRIPHQGFGIHVQHLCRVLAMLKHRPLYLNQQISYHAGGIYKLTWCQKHKQDVQIKYSPAQVFAGRWSNTNTDVLCISLTKILTRNLARLLVTFHESDVAQIQDGRHDSHNALRIGDGCGMTSNLDVNADVLLRPRNNFYGK